MVVEFPVDKLKGAIGPRKLRSLSTKIGTEFSTGEEGCGQAVAARGSCPSWINTFTKDVKAHAKVGLARLKRLVQVQICISGLLNLMVVLQQPPGNAYFLILESRLRAGLSRVAKALFFQSVGWIVQGFSGLLEPLRRGLKPISFPFPAV